MDKKDEIILQQLDVIRSMTERNLRSMNADFWGTPLSPADKTPEKAPDKTPEKARPAVRWQDRRRSACRQG